MTSRLDCELLRSRLGDAKLQLELKKHFQSRCPTFSSREIVEKARKPCVVTSLSTIFK